MQPGKQPRLWTANFTLLIVATLMGSAGGIAGGFAMSFLVFDETGSTLASALIIAIRFLPYIFLPLIVAPAMDRLPRKTFLVWGDVCNGLMYLGLGAYLMVQPFSYIGYLAISVVLSVLHSVDSLAYNSLFPDLLPLGAEQKGYAVSAMLYPVLTVIMTPMAAVLLDVIGVPRLLMIQGGLSLLAAMVENMIRVEKKQAERKPAYSFRAWKGDVAEGFRYLRQERGLRSLFSYMAVTNGVATGYSSILVAFFRTAPGFTAAMYGLFSVAEFIGRSIGSAVQYAVNLPRRKRFGFVYMVYMVYETMDMILLWIPYIPMLINRGICGFLGTNSAILRSAAVQRYIPHHLRSRVNACNEAMITGVGSVLALGMGLMGEVLDYRLCVTLGAAFAVVVCYLMIWRRRQDIRPIYEYEPPADTSAPDGAAAAEE